MGTMITAGEVKSKDDDDDDDHPQTLIMADAEDQFVLNQDAVFLAQFKRKHSRNVHPQAMLNLCRLQIKNGHHRRTYQICVD
jgi:sulfur transfer complex TusBCD TusB component (DsrH family)